MGEMKPNFRIIEKSDKDLEKETVTLFEKIQPLLDAGYSIKKAVKKTTGTNVTSNPTWFINLKKYCYKQGYKW